jgi:hypothetical protein
VAAESFDLGHEQRPRGKAYESVQVAFLISFESHLKGEIKMSHTTRAIIEAVKQGYGFDPAYYYCSMTGKPIGYTFGSELDDVVESIPGTVEEVADDVAMRVLASVRPSIKWNKRKSHPQETMAYLLGRLFTTSKWESRNWTQTKFNHDQILIFARLSDVEADSVSFKHCMLMLLEIEAKLQLVTEEPPFSARRLIDASDIIQALEDALTPYHAERMKAWLKAEREAIFTARNPGASRAYFKAWMDQAPISTEQSEAQVKKQVKKNESNIMAGLLDALMGDAPAKPVSPVMEKIHAKANAPSLNNKPLPKTTMPKVWGGLKKAAQ